MDNKKRSGKERVDEEFNCCGQVLFSYTRLRIPPGKVFKKKVIEKLGLKNQKAYGLNLLERNHIEDHSIVETEHPRKEMCLKKPTIKWPKANDAASYKKFDDDVARMTTKLKGDDDPKLESLM